MSGPVLWSDLKKMPIIVPFFNVHDALSSIFSGDIFSFSLKKT